MRRQQAGEFEARLEAVERAHAAAQESERTGGLRGGLLGEPGV